MRVWGALREQPFLVQSLVPRFQHHSRLVGFQLAFPNALLGSVGAAAAAVALLLPR